VYLVKGQGIRLVQLILLLFVTCEGQQLAIFTPSVCKWKTIGGLLGDLNCWTSRAIIGGTVCTSEHGHPTKGHNSLSCLSTPLDDKTELLVIQNVFYHFHEHAFVYLNTTNGGLKCEAVICLSFVLV